MWLNYFDLLSLTNEWNNQSRPLYTSTGRSFASIQNNITFLRNKINSCSMDHLWYNVMIPRFSRMELGQTLLW